VPLCDERLQGNGVIAEFLNVDRRFGLAGQGWQRYPELTTANGANSESLSEFLYPHARYLLALAGQSDAIDPKDIQPAYLRQKVAEKPLS
jgi:tRNA A37 threonylcarbamoyladenosine modification protein TsaB